MSLLGRKITLVISGGIAAYKACELVRELKRQGADIRVAMTENAQAFVSDVTFATLSEHPVASSLFSGQETEGVPHIELARWADLIVICPATANVIGKVAGGIADDFVTTTIMATTASVLICPAMNTVMWKNPIVQENVRRLENLGYQFVNPEWGELATSEEGSGWGRLAALEVIVDKIRQLLLASKELAGKTVVVTAGATRESIDPVRYITNRSSGKMGFALADVARLRGADVILIAGRNALQPPSGVRYAEVESVSEMYEAVAEAYDSCDVLIMAAAVSDYRPETVAEHKIKKDDSDFQLALTRTRDILATFADRKENRLHVGFALETEKELANAERKLVAKKLDLVVVNNPLQPGAAFGGDTNIVTLVSQDSDPVKLSKMSKVQVAEHVFDKVSELLNKRDSEAAVV